jgi:hypothetical protein
MIQWYHSWAYSWRKVSQHTVQIPSHSRIVALFITTKSTGECMKKTGDIYIYNHTHNGVLVRHKVEWNYIIYTKMEGTRYHDVNWNKPDQGRQISHVLSQLQNGVFGNEWQECKIGSAWGWEPEPEGKAKEEGKVGWIWLRYFINIYDSRIKKPAKIILKVGGGGIRCTKCFTCRCGNITMKPHLTNIC